MKELAKVTSQKQKPSAKKSKQLATASGLAKLRDSETCDSKSQKWRNQITCYQCGQRVVEWLLWPEYHIQGEEALERASFLLTDSAGIWYDMYERETEPEDRNIYSFLCLLRTKLTPEISKDELCDQYNCYHHAQLGKLGKPTPVNQYVQKLEEFQLRC